MGFLVQLHGEFGFGRAASGSGERGCAGVLREGWESEEKERQDNFLHTDLRIQKCVKGQLESALLTTWQAGAQQAALLPRRMAGSAY
jgi:hypothetical protein